jgi:protein ImuB
MVLGAAFALVPELAVRERDETAEARALSAVAAWAGQYTPVVSLVPSGVLLEVEGSLGLFGGVEGLAERVEEGVSSLGYRAASSLAPTPLAAEFLARAGQAVRLADLGRLEAVLAPLGLDVLDLPAGDRDALRGIGLRTLGDCLRLPRPGLLRRFGRPLVETLDRALGRVADPRPPFVPSPRFATRLELPAEVSAAELLLFAAHRLLLELEGFLRARGGGAERLRFHLFHRQGEPTHVEVGLASPGRDPRRLLGLLRERLTQTPLPGPVGALSLEVSDLSPLSPRSRDLFEGEGEGGQDGVRLVERLRARLGEEAVRGLCLVADHRPERAFQWGESSQGETPRRGVAPEGETPRRGVSGGLRPLWLLPEPAPLQREGLTLICGPERVESGWWDGADAVRDYFVAEDSGGSRLWVFRERRGDRRWFVQGIFG